MILRHKTLALVIAIVVMLSRFSTTVLAEGKKNNGNVYRHHDNCEMKIALTFDDGPHPVLTPKILDILRKNGAKATFFLVGENVKNYPDVVLGILSEGHEIANHTYTHDAINKNEIDSCEKAIYELTEYRTKLFRPPEGFMNHSLETLTQEMEYDIILWDIDTRDWDHTPVDVICDNVMKHIRSGSIILMHDYIGYRSPTPEVLEILLPKIKERGYQAVTVGELIGTK